MLESPGRVFELLSPGGVAEKVVSDANEEVGLSVAEDVALSEANEDVELSD